MDLKTKVWLQIAQDLEKKEKKGPLKDWKRREIDFFRNKLEEKLDSIGKQNTKKAIRLDHSNLRVLSYDRFLKIFRHGEKGGYLFENHFAIYLEFDSIEEYIEKQKIKEKYFSSSKVYRLPPLPEHFGSLETTTPYLGLKTFSPEESRLFFGRMQDQENIVNYIEENQIDGIKGKHFHNLILLYGQSGVGKSSLLQAGIFPRLTPYWDIIYQRKKPDVDLPTMFENAVKEKPRLILLEGVELIFSLTNTSSPSSELNAFLDGIKQFAKLNINRPLKIILASHASHLDQINQLLVSLDDKKDLCFLPYRKINNESTYLKQVIKHLKEDNIKLLLVSSLGQKHNLYKKIAKRLQHSWSIQYGMRRDNNTLGFLLRKKLEPLKLLVILDQIEEAITKPNQSRSPSKEIGKDYGEIALLLEKIEKYLRKKKDCKIILSFRENHLPNILDLTEKIIPNKSERFFLKPLDKEGIRQAIEGPLKNGSFHLKYYDEFVDDIIRILSEDKDSNIGPALQIIMKKLWEQTKMTNRFIDKELVKQAISVRGTIIEQFLKEQLEKIKELPYEKN